MEPTKQHTTEPNRPDPLTWLEDELAELEAAKLRRILVTRGSPQSAGGIELADRKLVNFSSNDYLGFAADKRLADAVRSAVLTCGWGSGASPLVTGRANLHVKLEHELANFEGTEAALLFASGYAANVGTVASLVGRGDLILSDAKNHASIIDGCRLSGARIQVYPHGDTKYLVKMLEQARAFRRRLIVTDSLFSMDGDLAPLPILADLADEFDAMLMVDEAHATGVFGETGRGVAEHFSVEDRIDVRVGTLSKGLGSMGGFVAGRQELIDWLANRARPYVFSTATPEAVCAAGLAALQIVGDEPERRQQLLHRAGVLRDTLRQDGWNIGLSASQIIPIIVGDPERTMQMGEALRQQGLLVPGIRPPTVPDGESLLRISLSYSHTDEMIDRLVDQLRELRDN
ncbi:MAG: 8-amino-7-oxononanoate synthase [Planctomycetes bacterium]|nr:8-amino-7-oxononanoate synthase [Planctomycetota bacterium]